MENNRTLLKIILVLQGLIILWLSGLSYLSLQQNFSPQATAEAENNSPSQAVKPVKPLGSKTLGQVRADQIKPTSILFEKEVFDFGTVEEGQEVKHIFKFKNTGTEPLYITTAKGSCGCTVPTWSQEAVDVGKTGQIEVVFDSKNRIGKNEKHVLVEGNFPSLKLQIQGEVIALKSK